MNVMGQVWLELTRDERLICLEFAAYQNAKRHVAQMKKATQAG